jgi:hypothetical protein
MQRTATPPLPRWLRTSAIIENSHCASVSKCCRSQPPEQLPMLPSDLPCLFVFARGETAQDSTRVPPSIQHAARYRASGDTRHAKSARIPICLGGADFGAVHTRQAAAPLTAGAPSCALAGSEDQLWQVKMLRHVASQHTLVARAVNGSRAAAHLPAAPVLVYCPPDDTQDRLRARTVSCRTSDTGWRVARIP